MNYLGTDIAGQIQQDLYAKCQSETIFAPVSMFYIREHRYQSEIDAALFSAGLDANQNGKLAGVTFEFLMPGGTDGNPSTIGVETTIEERIIVKENPTINL